MGMQTCSARASTARRTSSDRHPISKTAIATAPSRDADRMTIGSLGAGKERVDVSNLAKPVIGVVIDLGTGQP